jgi:hypothetical protein
VIRHDTKIVTVRNRLTGNRHYPKCSCGWVYLKFGGFEKYADAQETCEDHKTAMSEQEAMRKRTTVTK